MPLLLRGVTLSSLNSSSHTYMPTALNGGPQIAAANLTDNSATQEHVLGEKILSSDGRAFRYAKAGAVTLVSGTLLQAPIEVTAHQNLTPTAAAAGATSVTVALGATAATANQYAGGYVVVTVTPDLGQMYLISSHPAAALSTSLTLQLSDPIVTAWTTATRVDLVANQYNGVLINPTTATSDPVGVALTAITAGNFGWVQTGGLASILADGTITVGTSVDASNGVAGAVEAHVSGGVQAVVGNAASGIATTENGPIRLNDI